MPERARSWNVPDRSPSSCGAACCGRSTREGSRACRSTAWSASVCSSSRSSAAPTVPTGPCRGSRCPTGAGTSTLLSLLLRFYGPTDGAILFDGVDLRDLRHRDLMSQSSIVLQEPFLFIDTIANNIRMGRPGATLDEVVAAAKAAGVH